MRLARKFSCFRSKPVRTAAAWGIAAMASFLVLPTTIRAQGPSVEGRLVSQVRVVDGSGTPVTEKIPLLPLEAGKMFDFSAERAALRDLYRLGDFSDIRGTAERTGGARVVAVEPGRAVPRECGSRSGRSAHWGAPRRWTVPGEGYLGAYSARRYAPDGCHGNGRPWPARPGG